MLPTPQAAKPVPLTTTPRQPIPFPTEKSEQTTLPPYDPTGKPDPFQPTTVALEAKGKGKNKILPLERFEVTEFDLVGVISGPEIKKAMVQDLTGKGFFIQVGTRIGKRKGKVIQISDKEVIIEEPFKDFLGRKSFRKITLKLPQSQYGAP